ncbi:MAG TPA: biopolymer transporter ExbD [Thermoanaerobaculia bacterium]|nr:biopolymer transporter ExbD [Thermoanaerobaculia bacterium]
MNANINVTPLVDVVLVLLIIFMVITPVVQMGYLVKVPPKAPPGLPIDVMSDQIVLRYTPNNQIFINKEEVPPEQFPQRFREIIKGNTGKMVFFKGEADVNYEAAIKFLDMARASGARNIGIIVDDVQ